MLAEREGVLLVDKEEGITSAGVVRALKHKLRPGKIGHGGTLDPIATGLLVIFIGRATKLSSLFLDGDKVYSGTIRLGMGTDSDDVTGKIVATDEEIFARHPAARWEELSATLVAQFSGEQEQVPPQFSALKIEGKRSYDLARKGIAVNVLPRKVRISDLQLTFLAPDRMQYRFRCSKGTYVRSVARDIGQALGTYGCVETLRREETSGFSVAEAARVDDISLESLEEKLIARSVILERLSGQTEELAIRETGFV